MKLPPKPLTRVEKVRAALCASGSLALLVDAQGNAEKPCWRGSIADLAAALFEPEPPTLPSTETMAAHMDEFYSDSMLDNAGVPTG